MTEARYPNPEDRSRLESLNFVNNSDANHANTSKLWAWTEWGVGSQGWVPTAADQTSTFNAVNPALNAMGFGSYWRLASICISTR